MLNLTVTKGNEFYSNEESEQLLLAMWGMEHKGEEDHMQFRVMIDELEYFIELRVQS